MTIASCRYGLVRSATASSRELGLVCPAASRIQMRSLDGEMIAEQRVCWWATSTLPNRDFPVAAQALGVMGAPKCQSRKRPRLQLVSCSGCQCSADRCLLALCASRALESTVPSPFTLSPFLHPLQPILLQLLLGVTKYHGP